jgi:hypothetical protein
MLNGTILSVVNGLALPGAIMQIAIDYTSSVTARRLLVGA